MCLETTLLLIRSVEWQLQRAQFAPYFILPACKNLKLFCNVTTNCDVHNYLHFFHLGISSLFIGNLFPWVNFGMDEWGTMHCLLKWTFLKGVGLKGRKCGLDLSFFWNFFLFFFLIPPQNTKQKSKQLQVPRLMFHHNISLKYLV